VLDNNFFLELLKKYKNDILINYANGHNKQSLQNYDKGSVREIECNTIASIIRHFKYKRIIDVGTGPGRSCLAFAQALKDENIDGIVDTIDTNPETEARVLPSLERFGLQNYVRFHIGSSTDVIPSLNGVYQCALIDGEHSYSQSIIDFNNIYAKTDTGGAIFFHDVYRRPPTSPGVRNVIEDIVSKKPGQIVFFNEKLFDYFSFSEDIADARRIAEKWAKYNYSYVLQNANPKELMAVYFKE